MNSIGDDSRQVKLDGVYSTPKSRFDHPLETSASRRQAKIMTYWSRKEGGVADNAKDVVQGHDKVGSELELDGRSFMSQTHGISDWSRSWV